MAREPGPVGIPVGAYLVPGRQGDPRRALGQAQAGEACGLTTAWMSERWGTKDFVALASAVGQVTSRIGLGVGVTHFQTRHPAVLASGCMTIQALADERLVVGVGRSVASTWSAAGLAPISNQALIDSADIFRRLCRGERVSYDGPAGSFPALRLGDVTGLRPPRLVLAAVGPKSLELAGAHFDGAILHPFLTVEGVARSVAAVRAAAERAGRDPDDVAVHSAVVVVPDLTPEAADAAVVARAVTYFQVPGLGERLAEANGWDPGALATLRADPAVAGLRGPADYALAPDELVRVGGLLPPAWLREAAVVGSASHCADRLASYAAAGADEVIVHGSTPELLGPLLHHLRRAAP